jgi:hypothetical protein
MDAGSFSTANPCFRCDPATPTAQKALTTVLDNHCFIDNKCIDKGQAAPYYKNYNSNRCGLHYPNPPMPST